MTSCFEKELFIRLTVSGSSMGVCQFVSVLLSPLGLR